MYLAILTKKSNLVKYLLPKICKSQHICLEKSKIRSKGIMGLMKTDHVDSCTTLHMLKPLGCAL